MSESKKIYFAIRADEHGPANGPFLRLDYVEQWARAYQDDAWVIEVDAVGTFVARPIGGTEPTDDPA